MTTFLLLCSLFAHVLARRKRLIDVVWWRNVAPRSAQNCSFRIGVGFIPPGKDVKIVEMERLVFRGEKAETVPLFCIFLDLFHN